MDIKFVVITTNLNYHKLLSIFVPDDKESSKEKAKTSINIDKEVWMDWIKFVVNRTGSARKVSNELEKALGEYMKHHKE